ncbi:dsDNA-specific endonuclease/ATPase MutS2 [Natronobacillus azotifigens]|uniref:Endonuclease MutS2 n=1 Tax=Natronobacillus azotifigens TaxID=472978 RepID=A0A9J6RH12_9BACI|nr:endonuclease MutS2 [Natronobacillus azotifigens]MCZ0704619.1 endonuclease MutS2 [Natronobacillus azotifigens]
MDKNTINILEYHRILEQAASYALTNKAKNTLMSSTPSIDKKQIDQMLLEVAEAAKILKITASVPIHSLDEVASSLVQAQKGLYLKPDQLTKVITFLEHCKKLKRFMRDKEAVAPIITSYALSIENLQTLEDELTRSLKHGQIDDYATPELAKIRRHLRQKQVEVKGKAEEMVRSKRVTTFLQEKHVIEKNGQYTLPIKKEFKNKVQGQVIDVSASGATVFIMPNNVAKLQEEVDFLILSEENELQQILYTLTGLILEKEHEMTVAMDTMHHYDVIFAKAKYGLHLKGTIPVLNEEYIVDLKKARHPLLGEMAVPLSIRLGIDDRALVITGPNTGGKTVTLKTVGLLTLMAQTGLMIPAEQGSCLHLFTKIYADMGDGQSIDENLSTFSSRLKNIIHILEEAHENTLVLLDELGSGTDPNEGMALAQIILEQLVDKGVTLLATTHYSQLKNLAQTKEGFINCSMEFDLETLKPTYRLLLGETGKSQAFHIAIKLGMHPTLVERARNLTSADKLEKSPFPEDDIYDKSYQKQIAVNKYGRSVQRKKQSTSVPLFNQGDNVKVSPHGETGIVYQGPDDGGNYIVQVKGEKQTINHKRLTIYIQAKELYPEDYDFDTVFKSKEYRKKKHLMERKFVEGLSIKDE